MTQISDAAKAAAVMHHVCGDLDSITAYKLYDKLQTRESEEDILNFLDQAGCTIWHVLEDLSPEDWLESLEALALSIDVCEAELDPKFFKKETSSGHTVKNSTHKLSEGNFKMTHGEEQCKYALEHIKQLVDELNAANESNDSDKIDAANYEIQQYPLCVEVRDSSWHSYGNDVFEADEFRILLVLGGPHVQVVGEIEGCSFNAKYLQWAEWGTPLTNYPLTSEDLVYLRDFANHFGGY